MTTQSASTTTTGIGRALLGGLAAGVVAAAVNAALFATGLVDQSVVVPTGDPVSLGAVISLSLVPNVLAGLVLWGSCAPGAACGCTRSSSRWPRC